MKANWLCLCLALGWAFPAVAGELRWSAATRPFKGAPHPYLEARSTESESDASLRAFCGSAGAIELHVGANETVGKGEGDNVTLKLESDGRTATLAGKSRKSADFEMTAGTELVATVTAEDPVFALLTSDKAVKLTGSIRAPATWAPKGMRAAVEKFLAACKGR